MIPISLNPKTSQNINYKLTEAYLSKVLTIDDIAMLSGDIPTPKEENNKVIITNDYGVLDYSFIEPYTTGVSSEQDGDLIVTDSTGKLDNSFLHSTNSKLANSVVITDNNGYINYNLLKASVTPTANYIPIANASNKLNNAWLNSTTTSASSDKVVITDANGKINNSLLNASVAVKTNNTRNKSTIPISDASDGYLNTTWLRISKDGTRLSEEAATSASNALVQLNGGKIDSSLIPGGLYIPISGGEPTGTILIQGKEKGASTDLATLNSKLPNFYGFGTNAYSRGFIIGINTSGNTVANRKTNSEFLIATQEDYIPIKVRQYSGSQGYANLVNPKEITLMDASGNTSLNKLTVASDITSTNGALSVKNGITSTNGNLSIAGTSTLTGNVTAKGTLTVTGKTYANGGLEVNGASALKGNTSITGTLSSSNKATLNSLEITNDSALKGNLSVVGTSTLTGKLTANGGIGTSNITTSGTIESTGLVTAKAGIEIPISGDKVVIENNTGVPLLIGSKTSTHLEMDEDEIQAKSNATTAGTLYLNSDGGQIRVGDRTAVSKFYLNGRLQLIAQNPSVYSSAYKNSEPIKYVHPAENNTSYGNILVVGGRGNTIIAGGESAEELYDYTYNTNINGKNSDGHYGTNTTALNSDGDNLYLISDSRVYIQDHAQANYARAVANTITIYNGSITVPNSITASGSLTSGSLSTGPITASTITATDDITGKTVTATNFNGKWAGYTQDISTKPNITNNTQILLNNDKNIQYTTISNIKSLIQSVVASSIGASHRKQGYIKFDNGLIIQWGKGDFDGKRNINITSLPIAFTKACFAVFTTDVDGTGSTYNDDNYDISWSTNTLETDNKTSISFTCKSTGTQAFSWMALGV